MTSVAQVLRRVADLGAGGEDAEHRAGLGAASGRPALRPGRRWISGSVRWALELAHVGDPDQDRADHRAEHLPEPK